MRGHRQLFLSNLPLFASVFVIVMILGAPIEGPVFQLDEGGRLAQASTLAGKVQYLPTAYSFGYSLVIAPAFLLATAPQDIYLIVKAINAALLGGAACLLLRLLLQTSGAASASASRQCVLWSFVASLYPAGLVLGSTAFAEPLLFLLAPAVALSFYKAARLASPWSAVWLGLLIGLAYWTHSRMIFLAFAAPLAFLMTMPLRQGLRLALAVSVSAGLSICTYELLLAPKWQALMSAGYRENYSHYPSIAGLISTLFSGGFLASVRLTAGQFLYFNLAGYLLPGVLLARHLPLIARRFSIADENQAAVAKLLFFLIIGLVAMAAAGSLVFVHLERYRLDHWLYGRYLEVFLPTILLLSLARLTAREAVLSLVLTLVLALTAFAAVPDAVRNSVHINLLGIWPDDFRSWSPRPNSAATLTFWVVLSLLPALPVLLLLGAARRRLAMALLLACFLGTGFIGVKRHVSAASGRVPTKYAMADSSANKLREGACILLDSAGYNENLEVYAFYFGAFTVRHRESGADEQVCPDAILTPRPSEFAGSYPHIIAENHFDKLVLRARSSALQ